MSVSNFQLFLHREPHHEDSLEQLHAVFVENMRKLDGLLSLKKVSAPALPDFGEELLADYVVQYPLPSLSLLGLYTYRGMSYEYGDEAFYDDKIIVSFNVDALHLQYAQLLHRDFPLLIHAFGGYLARGFYADFATRYQKLHQAELDSLRAQKKVNVNGRNNVFSLQPVQFWGATLCRRAMDCDRDEVIHRLTGKVPLVLPLMDGVYVIFNDNPDLSFEEYCAYNDDLKPVLRLI